MKTLNLFAKLSAALTILFLTPSVALVCAQSKTEKQKTFQLSLAPALSTNGLNPGSYTNFFSINFTSGYSDYNRIFEIGTISNLNQNGTRGLQIAGISNVTGGNAYAGLNKKDSDLKKKSGFEASLDGLQIAGLTNIVINNVRGGQITFGCNYAKGALFGVQIAGVSNTVNKYSFGLQLAGGWNESKESMNGTMISGLMNYTEGELQGFQLSMLNHAGLMHGKNSFQNEDSWGVQLGFLNTAATMNGFQIGLVNFARHSQGTQIGLINIYKGGTTPNTKDGTAIGLFNAGDFGYIAVSADDLFGLNYELSTGNAKNRREVQKRRSVYVLNSLIYSRQGFNPNTWALGYGLKKMLFNISTQPGMSEYRFIAYELDFLHINQQPGKWTSDISMVTRLKLTAGTRISPKLFGIYVFGGLTFNNYYSETGYRIAPSALRSENISSSGRVMQFWPGVVAGVLIH